MYQCGKESNMSEKNVLKGMKVKACGLSDDKNVTPRDSEQASFRPYNCPRCGKDSLRPRGFGELDQSQFVGVTGEGVPGLAYDLPGRDYRQGITCQECGYDFSLKGPEQSNALLEWAHSNGEEIPAPGFACPVCGTHKLVQVQLLVEIHREIAAVCEIASPALPDKKPMVTLTGERLVMGGPPYRYRCENDHELANDDGTPVKNTEELVEWLKACSASDNG
jgi:transcription elongation factor Elf1